MNKGELLLSFYSDPLSIDSQKGIVPSDLEDDTPVSSTPGIKDFVSAKDERVDVSDLLSATNDVRLVDLFKTDDTVHIYAENKQSGRPKKDRK